MTGGQPVAGAMDVPELAAAMAAEGASRIVVCSDDPDRFDGAAAPGRPGFPPGTDVWPRERLEEAQLALRDTPGVTVLIYDQRCAAEKRRDRKRGVLPTPTKRIFINEAVCEGCGDCGAKSHCLSVQPVETEFGPKTRIHQSSCNFDYTCIEGDCPSFIEVAVPPLAARPRPAPSPPAPARAAPRAGPPGRSRRRVLAVHGRDGRHRRGHRQPGAGHRRSAGRTGHLGPGPDRAQPEGRSGGVAPAPVRRPRRWVQLHRRRAGRLLSGPRPAGGGQPPQPGPGRSRPHFGRGVHQPGAHRRDGGPSRRVLPRRRRPGVGHRPGSPAKTTTSISTPSGWPRACSATTCRPTS